MDRAEHVHLRALPRRHAGPRAFVPERVPGAVRRLVEGLAQPAYVTGRRWDLLAWNAAADLFPGFARVAEADRNVLLYMLTDPGARSLFGAGWTEEARRMVAQFRATHDLWAGDPAFAELLARLRRGSPEFASWWEAHDVRRGGTAGQKLLYHPERGPRRFEYATFQSNDDPALKLAIYTPV